MVATLLVYVPSLRGSPKEWLSLIGRLRQEPQLAGADWLGWNHDRSILSTRRASTLADTLRARIDEKWITELGRYDKIILMGHSFGALLVRKAFLLACGAASSDHTSDWHSRVSRIVLFAATNRGVDARRRWWMRVLRRLYRAGRALHLMPHFLVSDVLSGAAFLTQLRLEWIRHFRDTDNDGLPEVVQLLGTHDEFVSPKDSLDLLQFPKTTSIAVPDASHRNVHIPETSDDPDTRYKLLRYAIIGELLERDRELPSKQRNPVVFVLHGIRASNSGWPDQIKDLILKEYPDAEVVLPGYGYFSALNFALPWIRRRHIELFQDSYSEALAKFADADFHLIGHSNGTYLLGASLMHIPAIRFQRIALIGSVLPADYDWQMRFKNSQVTEIRNHRSCRDWPVGILCSGLRSFRMTDIGTGGFDGFHWNANATKEIYYYRGGHSAPLSSQNLANLASYVLTGRDAEIRNLIPSPSFLFGWASRLLGRWWFTYPLLIVVGWLLWNLTGWLGHGPVFGLWHWLLFAAALLLATILLATV